MTGAVQRHVYCIGTLDTKDADVCFLAESISSALSQFLPSSETVEVVTVDVSSTSSGKTKGDVTREDVLSHHPDPSKRSLETFPSERSESVSLLSDALTGFLSHCHAQGSLAGAIGIGGSGGTSLIAPALRALPLGVPKVIISTVASGSTTPYIETSDLILIPSVVDVAGLNSVSRRVITNGAAALAGMVASKNSSKELASDDDSDSDNPSVGLTMFGVTTPCVTAVQNQLTGNGFETLVFHATGRGGQAMENFVGQGLIKGVIDITTSEVADFIVGGTMACTDLRFEETLKQGVPLVLSVGALDMVNFGPRDSVPPQFATRNLYVHNDQVTLVRTTKEENEKFARFIAQRLNKSTGPVRILLPEKGISALDAPGMAYYDPDIRSALFDTLEHSIEKTSERQVTRLPHHINDPEFANALVGAFLEIMPQRPRGKKTHEDSVARGDGTTAPRRPKIQHLPLANPGLKQKYKAALDRLWDQIEAGAPIIGAGAGTGISAKFEEQGGIDLIVIYNSGRFRMAGRGSLSGLLPFKDANAVVVEMANEILPVIKSVPVLVGVCATDPFRHMGTFLRELEGIGFCGVQNFPTVGLFDGTFRQNLEETGMGYGLEVEMIRQAHAMGFMTTPYAFNESEARAMAEAGADVIVAHMGLTTSGSIGATSGKTLDQSVELVQAIADAALQVNPHVIVLCHGGPIASPDDAEFVLKRTRGVHGFYGASSVERLPVELAITDQVKRFKAIKFDK